MFGAPSPPDPPPPLTLRRVHLPAWRAGPAGRAWPIRWKPSSARSAQSQQVGLVVVVHADRTRCRASGQQCPTDSGACANATPNESLAIPGGDRRSRLATRRRQVRQGTRTSVEAISMAGHGLQSSPVPRTEPSSRNVRGTVQFAGWLRRGDGAGRSGARGSAWPTSSTRGPGSSRAQQPAGGDRAAPGGWKQAILFDEPTARSTEGD